MNATLYTDGGARGNPGPAGIGYVLRIEGRQPITHGEYIGEMTNNQAEYMALLAGLGRAQEEGVTHMQCFLDSELIVRQLNGVYRVKEKHLRPLVDQVLDAARHFESVVYRHVPREKNKQADRLVNDALDRR